MQTFSKLVLLMVASIALVVGVSGAIIFFPVDRGEVTQAIGASPNSMLTWQTSLAAASEQAKQEHKYVLADVYTDWCGWCKKLDKDVFTNSKLVRYLQKDFICVKVNAEDAKEGAAVATTYKVNGYPCALVFSTDGKLIGRISGYENAHDYEATLQQMRASANTASQPQQ